jgi:hypothetical protein
MIIKRVSKLLKGKALTLQQFTDRLNNHSRSLGSLELIIANVDTKILFYEGTYSTWIDPQFLVEFECYYIVYSSPIFGFW